MRFSDVVLSVGFVGLAAADVRASHCSKNPNGILECLLDPTPASTNTCPTTTLPVVTTTTTAWYTIKPTDSAGSRRYSVPGLFMLPHRILGLMAGARPAAADKAIKTFGTTTTQTATVTTEATSYVATEIIQWLAGTKTVTPVTETVTGLKFASAPTSTSKDETRRRFVVAPSTSTSTETVTGVTFASASTSTSKTEAPRRFVLSPSTSTSTETVTGVTFASTSTKASKPSVADIVSSVDPRDLLTPSILYKGAAPVMAGVGADRASSDELLTSTFVPVNTETFLPSVSSEPTTTATTTTTATVNRFEIVPVTPSVILPSVSSKPTTTTTVTVNRLEIVKFTPSVILPSVSAEPSVTSTDTVVTTTTTTKQNIGTKTLLAQSVKYVVATGEATQSAQPPKIFTFITSLLKK